MAFDPANPFASKTGGGGDPYEYMRQRATQDANNSQAGALDAMTRKMAAQGNLNSGSYIKGIEELNRQAQQQGQDARGKIDLAETQGALPYAQMGLQREQMGQQESQFAREMPLKSRQLDLEANQQALDAHANDINQALGEWQNSHSGGLLGGGGFLGLGMGGSGQSGLFNAKQYTGGLFG